jgi:16S rRNA (uracil1498-N3)-methyltransferase
MPRPPRFFISPGQVSGSRITVTGGDVRHIAGALRMKPGETLVLCNGKGTEYAATIMQSSRTEIVAEIVSETKREMPWPRVTLGQGLPKSDKMDWIVQKATELGVSNILPLATERTIVKIKDEEKRINRWQNIAREAAMQSNRYDIPTVGPIISFRDFIMTLDPGPLTLKLFPWEEGTEPIKNVLRQNLEVKNIVIFIGPEGGFSVAEADMAKSRGFHRVSLGPNILRTETAAIAVLSMVGYEYSAASRSPV